MRTRILLRCRLWQPAVLLLALVLGSAVPAGARRTPLGIGTITDAQGGVLPGVTVTIREVNMGTMREAVTEGEGRYRIGGLQPGTYDLTAELPGFETVQVTGITFTIGLEVRRDITMQLAGVQESVTVTGETPVVEPTRTAVTSVITQEQIDTLPISNRDVTSLALLLPGTTDDAVRRRRSNANIGGGSLDQTQTQFHVDGAMNWSVNAGEPLYDVPQSGVREFQVLTSASAEYGTTTGGAVVIVTKSGTNQVSGEGFYLFRDKALNRPDMFTQARMDEFGDPKPAFRQHNYGGGVGFPIVRDKVHFFGAYERRSLEEAFTVSTGRPDLYGALEGIFPNTFVKNNYLVRGDIAFTPQQSLFVRYVYMGETSGCEQCGGTNAAFSDLGTYNYRDSLVFGHTWAVTDRLLNEVRFQGPSPSRLRYVQYAPGSPHPKAADFTSARYEGRTPVYSFPSLTWGSSISSFNRSNYYQFTNNLSYILADHAFKFGVAHVWVRHDEDQPDDLGTWTFAEDQFFDGSAAAIANLQDPIQYSAAFAGYIREHQMNILQTWIQDEWRPRPDLTVNLGLRYEVQYRSWNQELTMDRFPRPLPLVDFTSRHDHNNFGPRIGIAWDLFQNGRSIARVGYGRYYQHLAGTPTRNERSNLLTTNIVVRNPSYPDPYGGLDPLTFASTAPPNISIVANDIRNPSSDTVTVGFSQELGPALAVHFDGVVTRMRDLTRNVELNTPDPVTGEKALPEWGRVTQAQARGKHHYNALLVRLEKRYSNRNQFLVSYTLSKQDNDAGMGTGSVTDINHPEWDWGPGYPDRRHMIVASGSVLLPGDVLVGAVWTARTTMPFSSLAGMDLNGDKRTTDYVPGTTRDMGNRETARMLELVNAWRAENGRAPISADQIDTNVHNQMDLRLSKSFELGGNRQMELVAQVFNVFGRDNLTGPQTGWVTNALSASFGRILEARPRQQAELGVRVTF